MLCNQMPDNLKVAQISPVFKGWSIQKKKKKKKKRKKKKKKYGTVRILPTHSKIFERTMFDPFTDHIL